MTTSVIAPLTEAEKIFYDLVWTPAIQTGEAWLEGVVPILGAPVVKQADEEIIKVATDALFNQIILIIDITAIKMINSAHQTAYDNASLELKIVTQEKGVASDDYQTALQAALVTMSRFTNINSG